MVNYTKRAVHGAGIVFLMGIAAVIVSYITRIILARQLGPENYGLFYAVLTFIMFFLFFRDLGMGTALVKYIPEFRVKRKFNEIKTAVTSVLIFQVLGSVIFAIVLILLSKNLEQNYFRDPAASTMLYLFIIYVIGSVFFRLSKTMFNAFQNMKIFSLFEFLKNFIFLLLTLLFFYLGFGFYAPAIAYALLCYLIVLLLLHPLLQTFPIFKYKIVNFWPTTKKIFLFGLPVFATGIASKIISSIDTLILTYFRTLAEVGIYNVILPSSTIFLHFGASISAVVFPIVSELWAKKDKKKISIGLRLLHRYSFVFIIPPALIVIAFSKHFINFFFGEQYISGALALQILMLGALLFVVAGINHSIISAIGKPKIVAKIVIFAALLNFIANMLLIPHFGIEGAAFSTTLSYLVVLILSTYSVVHYIPVEFPKEVWLKLLFAGLVFVGIVMGLKNLLVLHPWIEVLLTTSIAGAVYLALMYFMKIIDINELKIHIKLILKRG